MNELWNWDGKRIRSLRIKIGCSANVISKSMNIGFGTYINAEKNERYPSINTLLVFSDFFNVPLDYLLGKMNQDEEQAIIDSFDANDQKYYSLRRIASSSKNRGMINGQLKFPLSLGYPLNLAFDVCVGGFEFSEEDIYSMSEDQRNGVNYAIDILPEYVSERNKMILFARYRDLKTFAQIGREFNLTTERIRQIIKKILRMLRHPHRKNYIVFGRYGYENILNAKRESRKREIENIIQNEEDQAKTPVIDTSIDDLGLSVRAYNSLRRAGIRNTSMLLDFLASDEAEHEINFLKLGKIRNCGRKTYDEIANALMKIGVIREIKKDIHGAARYASVNYKYD